MLDLSTAFATFPILETERLHLREATADDAAAMFQILSDPKVVRYFGSPPMASLDAATQRVARWHEVFVEQNGIRWAITWRENGAFLGSCGFWRLVKPHFRAEIGYELSPDWWGRGVMPEAVSAMLRFGFTAMGLHSVEANIDPANNASRRVLEKLGFVQEGYFRESFYDPITGRFTDAAIFSLLKSAWEAA